MNVMLYIGNLGASVTEAELRTLFSQEGEVTSIRLLHDRLSDASEQYGFVAMSSQSEADHAVSRFNHYEIGTRPLRVGLVRMRRTAGILPPFTRP